MRERIRPPKELEIVLDRLKDESQIFETKQKGLMFAAAVGCVLFGEQIDTVYLESFGEGIRIQYFTQQDDGFIDAIAVARYKDLAILHPDKQPERIDLFERYAMLGLKEIQKRCFDSRPDDPIEGVLSLIDDMYESQNGDLPGLDGVFEKLGDYL